MKWVSVHQPATIKNVIPVKVCSSEFCEMFKKISFNRAPLETAPKHKPLAIYFSFALV